MWGKMLLGASAIGATATGGVLGAAYAGQTEGDMTTGTVAGATIGAGAVGLVAGAPKALSWSGGKITEGATWAASEAGRSAIKSKVSAIGAKALGVSKTIGLTTGAVGAAVGATTAAVGGTMAIKAGAKYGNVAASMFKLNKDFGLEGNKGGTLNLTKKGHAMLAVGSAVSMGASAFNTFMDSKKGQSDGQVLTATPDFARSSTMRNAGATGDLAFAAYSQRK